MAFETFAVHAACIRGVEAIPVTVEVSLAGGIPGIQMLGIPSMEVMESRGRIRCAMRSAGFEIPRSGITVNLAPGDIRKTPADSHCGACSRRADSPRQSRPLPHCR